MAVMAGYACEHLNEEPLCTLVQVELTHPSMYSQDKPAVGFRFQEQDKTDPWHEFLEFQPLSRHTSTSLKIFKRVNIIFNLQRLREVELTRSRRLSNRRRICRVELLIKVREFTIDWPSSRCRPWAYWASSASQAARMDSSTSSSQSYSEGRDDLRNCNDDAAGTAERRESSSTTLIEGTTGSSWRPGTLLKSRWPMSSGNSSSLSGCGIGKIQNSVWNEVERCYKCERVMPARDASRDIAWNLCSTNYSCCWSLAVHKTAILLDHQTALELIILIEILTRSYGSSNWGAGVK